MSTGTDRPPAVLEARFFGPLTWAGIVLVAIGLAAWLTSMYYAARRASDQRTILLGQLRANHALGERLERRLWKLEEHFDLRPEPIPRPEARP